MWFLEPSAVGADAPEESNGLAAGIHGAALSQELERALERTRQDAEMALHAGRAARRAPHEPSTGPACTASSLSLDFVSRPPDRVRRDATLHPLQEWEGCVVKIRDGEIVAQLVDLTAGDSIPTEEVTIPVRELSEHDAARVQLGSIFRWVIGYERAPGEPRQRVSQIVFRDLPRWTEADVREAKAWARAMARALNP